MAASWKKNLLLAIITDSGGKIPSILFLSVPFSSVKSIISLTFHTISQPSWWVWLKSYLFYQECLLVRLYLNLKALELFHNFYLSFSHQSLNYCWKHHIFQKRNWEDSIWSWPRCLLPEGWLSWYQKELYKLPKQAIVVPGYKPQQLPSQEDSPKAAIVTLVSQKNSHLIGLRTHSLKSNWPLPLSI